YAPFTPRRKERDHSVSRAQILVSFPPHVPNLELRQKCVPLDARRISCATARFRPARRISLIAHQVCRSGARRQTLNSSRRHRQVFQEASAVHGALLVLNAIVRVTGRSVCLRKTSSSFGSRVSVAGSTALPAAAPREWRFASRSRRDIPGCSCAPRILSLFAARGIAMHPAYTPPGTAARTIHQRTGEPPPWRCPVRAPRFSQDSPHTPLASSVPGGNSARK